MDVIIEDSTCMVPYQFTAEKESIQSYGCAPLQYAISCVLCATGYPGWCHLSGDLVTGLLLTLCQSVLLCNVIKCHFPYLRDTTMH